MGRLVQRQGKAMCERCIELDTKIARYRELRTHTTDQMTSDGISGLIRKMVDEKAAPHPDGNE
jgi:hypothetical protein